MISLVHIVKQKQTRKRERVRGRGIYLPLGDAPISNSAAQFRHFTCLDLRTPCTCTPDLPVDLRTLSTCTPDLPVGLRTLCTCTPDLPVDLCTLFTCTPDLPVDLRTLCTCTSDHLNTLAVIVPKHEYHSRAVRMETIPFTRRNTNGECPIPD